MLSLFSPRSIRHFLNCRRKQTKTEILFSYLIIFEVNNRFVAFSIDKNFQKSTEIGSQFHNLPTACSSVSPASSLSFSLRPPLPACSPAVSLPPCPHASAVSARCPSTASSFSRSVLPPPLNRRFLRFGLYIRRGLRPASPNFAFPAPAGRLPQPASSPAVSSNLPQPASSLSFSLRPPLPACSPAVSLPPCPHASAVSARCPSTASSFSRSVLPPPLNRRFLRFGLYIRRGLRPASPNFAFPAPAGRLPQPASSPAVSSNLPQPASSLSFSLRPPLPACSPAVSLPPCPHASAVSARCPSTASSFSRSVLPPPLNRRFLHSGGLFDALSLCPISFLQSKKTCRKHVFSFRHFFTACIPVPQQKHPACNRIHPARFRGFSAPTKPASGSICGCRKT